MKVFLPLLLLLLLVGCSDPKEEAIRKPDYFFVWDAENSQGHCLNENNQEGYNPMYIGPCGDLRGMKFSYSSLDGIDLRGAILDGVDLSKFSLNGANLTGVKARGAHFMGSQLNGAKLNYGEFQGSRFDGAHMNGADLSHAQLSGVKLTDAKVYGSSLKSSDVSGALLPQHLRTVDLKLSQYSYGTKLPFGEKHANARGMWTQAAESPSNVVSKEPIENRLPTSVVDNDEAKKEKVD